MNTDLSDTLIRSNSEANTIKDIELIDEKPLISDNVPLMEDNISTIDETILSIEDNTPDNSDGETDNNLITCRICLSEIDDVSQISYPCKCSGSSKYVHLDCINNWRNQHSTTSQQYTHCMECNYKYVTETSVINEKTHILIFKGLFNKKTTFAILFQLLSWFIGFELCKISSLKKYLTLSYMKTQEKGIIIKNNHSSTGR